MSDQRSARIPRRDRFENAFQRLQKDVQRSGTHTVLDSLPAPESFVFHKTKWNGCDTVKLLLGDRPNPNGSTSQAWARIVSATERTDLQPPVLFYDQELSADGTRTLRYPRSASSLLRKATKLQPPFCFLQHDSIDEATKVREMLSAVILYLVAVRNIDACAWQWDEFVESFVKALNYIQSRDAYNHWRHEQKLAALRPPGPETAAERGSQKELEQETNLDQPSDPVAEGTRIPSPVDVNEYPCGIVRSTGSAIAIQPNTSLAKLKQELGDRRFKLLDNIPSKPMAISRHSLGGTLFPFRMLIGKAEYKSTGETIEIYAYIDHERAKQASMIFMSHDSEGLEQTYDVNLLRDGVTLVDHLEYLNTLKKESYKDDAKSARTAKLRSLICYYFFIAENEGLISKPDVDINGGFCSRICAVCHELGKKDWGSADSVDGEDTDEGRTENIDVQGNGHWSAQYANEFGDDDIELVRRDENEAESSRIVRLRIRPEVLSKAIGSGSVERQGELSDQESLPDQSSDDLLEARSLVDDAHTLEVELRPSSQVVHEASQPPTGVINSHYAPSGTPLLGSNTMDATFMLSKLPTTMADGTAEHIPLDKSHAESSEITTAEQSRAYVDLRNSYIKTDMNTRAIDQHIQSIWSTRPDDDQDGSSDEFVPVNISPVLTPNHSYASKTALSKSTSGSVIDDAVVSGRLSDYAVTQIGGRRPPTPEGSAERDLKSQAMSVNLPGRAPHAFAAVDAILISDDEDRDLVHPPLRSTFDHTLEAKSVARKDVQDITQLSSRPRGKKRKSLGPFYLSDTDDDIIAETDGREWHRKSRGRNK